MKEPGKGGLLFALSLMSIAKQSLIGYYFTDEAFFSRHNHAFSFAMLDVTISTCLIACRYITCVAEGSASMHISQSLLAALMRLTVSFTQALSVTQQLWAMLSLACFDMCLVCKIKVTNLMQCIMDIVLIILPDFKRHSCLMLLIAAYISRSSTASYWV